MEPNMQNDPLDNYGQNPGFPEQTTQQERLSQPERMTGNHPDEINPNAPQTGNNPNEINPNIPETGNQPNEISPNRPETGNDPNQINPNHQPAEYEDPTRHQQEIRLPEQKQEKTEGYAEAPSEEYIPEINGNEKYQQNYQDDEQPQITE